MEQQQIFKKNVERWALFCPDKIDELLSLADEEPQDCGPLDRQNLLEVAKEEIKKFAIRDVKILYVLGMECGVVYDALKEWLRESEKNQIVFLEPDLKVIQRLLMSDKGSEIVFDPQVWLYFLDPEGRLLEKVTTLFVIQRWNLFVLKQYEEKHSSLTNQIRTKLSFLSNLKHSTTDEYLHYGYGYFQNFFRNMNLLPQAFLASGLYGRFANIPAIICGAGPSLKKNLKLLETLKDKALIFAGGTAMNAVNANGFTPHFGVGIDPNPDQFTRLITNTAFETPYFYRNRLLHDGLKLIHADHLYVPGSGGYGITRWCEEQLGISGKDLSEGCNVINFSLSIAAEMGCSPIIFVGVDLAYTDEESYAPGILNHPLHTRKDYFKTKSAQEELIVKPDIYGNEVYTLWKWVLESYWFSHYAAINPHLKLINATEGGLGFVGIANMTLKEAADKFLSKQQDLSGLVHRELQQSRMPSSVTLKNTLSVLKELELSLERSLNGIYSIHSDIKQLAFDRQAQASKENNFLPEEVKEKQQQLERELAYRHFLGVFDEAFSRSLGAESLRLEIEKDFVEAEHVKKDFLKNLARRYQFLHETAQTNLNLLKAALEEAEERKELPRVNEASLALRHSDQHHRVLQNSAERSGGLKKHELLEKDGSIRGEYYTLKDSLHGPYVYYDASGSKLSESFFKDGLRHGDSILYYSSGKIASIQHFVRGHLEGELVYFYPDGKLKTSLNYFENNLSGPVKLYDRQGNLRREANFFEGRREGFERFWNEKGLLVIEAEYGSNKPKGVARRWHENGTLAQETYFNESGIQQEIKKWNKEGVLIENADEDRDYFDQVTAQAGVLTASLDNVVNQLTGVAPIFEQAMSGRGDQSVFAEIDQELQILNEEMKNLKRINQQLIQEAGLDVADHKEPLWKSPSSRKELEIHVEQKADLMSQELASIQIALAKTIEAIIKGENNPPPNSGAAESQ